MILLGKYDELIYNLEVKLSKLAIKEWLSHDLFSLRWWFLVMIFIGLWIVWYRLVDKKMLGEILLFGCFASAFAVIMDELGSELTIWYYSTKLLPIFPRFLPYDYAILPIPCMLIYQYYPKWKHFIIADMVLSITVIAGQALFGFYKMLNPYGYFFIPICFLMLLFLKWFMGRFIMTENKARSRIIKR